MGHPVPVHQGGRERAGAGRWWCSRDRPSRRSCCCRSRSSDARWRGRAQVEADARLHDRRDRAPVVLPELGRATTAQLDRGAPARHRPARRRGHRVRDGASRAALPPELARHHARNARRRSARRAGHRRVRSGRGRRDVGRGRRLRAGSGDPRTVDVRPPRRRRRRRVPGRYRRRVRAVRAADRWLAGRVAVPGGHRVDRRARPWSAAPSRSCSWSGSSPRSAR